MASAHRLAAGLYFLYLLIYKREINLMLILQHVNLRELVAMHPLKRVAKNQPHVYRNQHEVDFYQHEVDFQST